MLWPPPIGEMEVVVHDLAGVLSQVTVLTPNPARWSIWWGQPQTTSYRFGPSPTISSTLGFIMSNSFLPIQFLAKDDPGLVCGPWYAASVGAATGWMVVETIYRPRLSMPAGE